MVAEVHDRDRCLEREQRDAVFGRERRDELLGTHAFGAGEITVIVCNDHLYIQVATNAKCVGVWSKTMYGGVHE